MTGEMTSSARVRALRGIASCALRMEASRVHMEAHALRMEAWSGFDRYTRYIRHNECALCAWKHRVLVAIKLTCPRPWSSRGS